jgi:chromosome partitioning protein
MLLVSRTKGARTSHEQREKKTGGIDMPAKVIVLPNHKGGVTKTSSSATFLVLLHLLGVRVLGIDTDPQSNLSSLFGYKTPLKEKTAYDAIMGQVPLQETIRHTYINPENNAFYVPKSEEETVAGTRFGPSISPMGFKGTDADNELKNSEDILFWPNQLRDSIAPLRETFDYILVDTPPSLGTLTTNALVAADYIVIPMTPEIFALEGLSRLLGTVQRIKQQAHSNLRLIGMFLSKVQSYRSHRDIAQILTDPSTLGTLSQVLQGETLQLLTTTIKQNAAFGDALNKKSLLVLDKPNSEYTFAYWFLLHEILEQVGGPAAPKIQQVVKKIQNK